MTPFSRDSCWFIGAILAALAIVAVFIVLIHLAAGNQPDVSAASR